ncbi:ubiquitin domain containing protein family [Histomonas meleagridis]|uniref:ubiquitin domain containing protein family n=1 Tax=Histomonas meleagridis TaxID=135588 RepID=UPI00355996FC|nr:ubiquitin domain containing protein family [Histomonas meleagridis]KAH0798275.1 ubiquitin domain containing protein family [Histomonas meleagridis]
MQITLKGSGGNVFQIEINDNATVKDLKDAIQNSKGIDPKTLRLIYSGKVLADSSELKSYGIQDGHTVHMFVAKPKTTPPPQPSQPSNPVPPPPQPSQPSTESLPEPPSFNQQNPFMAGFPNLDFNALFNNPMIQQMMNQMAENPQLFADLIRNNPMFANNPMYQQIANNPELIAQSMRMFQNATNTNSQTGTSNPNPNQFNPFGGLDINAMMNDPNFQQVMNQMAQNPQLSAELIRNNPMFANNPMFQELVNNPELLAQNIRMAQSVFGGNDANPNTSTTSTSTTTTTTTNTNNPNPFSSLLGQPQQTTTTTTTANSQFHMDTVLLQHLLEAPMLPQHTVALQNAEVQRGLTLIQQGIRLCRANGLLLMNNVPNIDAAISHVPQPGANQTESAPHLSPQERFGPQLETMNSMGLSDNERNIQALIATNGNVTAAIEYIFTHP